jgi:hypothetical protein
MPSGIGGGKLQGFSETINANAAPPSSVHVIPRDRVTSTDPPPVRITGIGGGGSLEGGPLTPDLIHRISPGSFPVGQFTMPPSTAGWFKVAVDRPLVLLAMGTEQTGCSFFYNYGVAGPTFQSGSQNSIGGFLAAKSERGIAFLSAPGDWWFRNAALTGFVVYLYDAFNPGVLARWLTRPGCNIQNEGNATLTLTTEVVVQTGNVGRSALTVQNTGGGPIRVYVGAAGYLTTATGFRLAAQGGSITFSGDTLARGDLRALCETASPSVVEYAEYLMW